MAGAHAAAIPWIRQSPEARNLGYLGAAEKATAFGLHFEYIATAAKTADVLGSGVPGLEDAANLLTSITELPSKLIGVSNEISGEYSRSMEEQGEAGSSAFARFGQQVRATGGALKHAAGSAAHGELLNTVSKGSIAASAVLAAVGGSAMIPTILPFAVAGLAAGLLGTALTRRAHRNNSQAAFQQSNRLTAAQATLESRYRSQAEGGAGIDLRSIGTAIESLIGELKKARVDMLQQSKMRIRPQAENVLRLIGNTSSRADKTAFDAIVKADGSIRASSEAIERAEKVLLRYRQSL